MDQQLSVLDILPQRHPFLLIDKILEIDTDTRIVAIKNLSLNDPILQGNIPGHPYVPGSLLIEIMVQAASALMLSKKELTGQKTTLESVSKFTVSREPNPTDQLRVEVTLKRRKDTAILFDGKLFADGTLIAEGAFSFALSKLPSKPKIHPTASVHPSAILGKDVVIGPYSIVGEEVIIGDNTIIEAHVLIDKWTKIGEDNHIHFGCVIGSAAQDTKYTGEQSWIIIGDRNEIREYVTINRATGKNAVTQVGSDNMILTNVHIGHNCTIGNNVTMANAIHLGGHVRIDDYVVMGGMSGLHQFTRIGKAAMVGGYSRINQDVPPFTLCMGNPAYVRTLNLVGLKRQKIKSTNLRSLKTAYRLLYRSNKNIKQAIDEIESTLESDEWLDTLLAFLKEDSSRGISKKTDESVDDDV